ncbi:hypothetical protein Dsin_009999 [Dipteronia sinensis]|uniref:Transposase n=1 Tax=Dipteronia sinensis TaxID=43782 RepID=A0AAE0ASY5_9ROSI|nr:hypothetical protein Dsin_009999 [Dipteronia sinensis]
MEELHNLHQNAFDYVVNVWLKSGPVSIVQRRYKLMTTNVVECLNSYLRFAQKLPMMTLAEFIRKMLQRWYYDRHRAAHFIRHQLTDAAYLVISKRIEKCSYMTGAKLGLHFPIYGLLQEGNTCGRIFSTYHAGGTS